MSTLKRHTLSHAVTADHHEQLVDTPVFFVHTNKSGAIKRCEHLCKVMMVTMTSLGLVSLMLHYLVVKTVKLVSPIGMHRVFWRHKTCPACT